MSLFFFDLKMFRRGFYEAAPKHFLYYKFLIFSLLKKQHLFPL